MKRLNILLILTILWGAGCIHSGQITIATDEFKNCQIIKMDIFSPKVKEDNYHTSKIYFTKEQTRKVKPSKLTFNFTGPEVAAPLTNKAFIKIDEKIHNLKLYNKYAQMGSYTVRSQTTKTTTNTKTNSTSTSNNGLSAYTDFTKENASAYKDFTKNNSTSGSTSFGPKFGNAEEELEVNTEIKTTSSTYNYMNLIASIELNSRVETRILNSKKISFRFYSGENPITIKISEKELNYIKNFLTYNISIKKKAEKKN
jgi:hypothetical protein